MASRNRSNDQHHGQSSQQKSHQREDEQNTGTQVPNRAKGRLKPSVRPLRELFDTMILNGRLFDVNKKTYFMSTVLSLYGMRIADFATRKADLSGGFRLNTISPGAAIGNVGAD